MRLSWLVVLSGCGFQPGASSDAALGGELAPPHDAAGPGSDAAMARDCTSEWFAPNLHFTPRRRLDVLATTFTERDPSLSHNELQIWFSSDRGGVGALGGTDVWTATRTTIDDAFGTPVVAVDASSPQDDGKYAISEDELSYAVASNRTGTKGGFDIWVSHRETGGENFPPADNLKLVPSIDDGNDQYDPWINDDATHLYYAPSSGGQRIMVATRPNANAQFGAAVAVDELNLGSPTADPTLFDGERIVVFSTVIAANDGGATNTDLWFATRTDPAQPFSPPQHLADLSTPDFEGDPWVSANGCHIYFAGSKNSDYDLYEAEVM
ncbi:MAG: hypothetical protein ABI467_18500 [Kofleriaceae bacterium]